MAPARQKATGRGSPEGRMSHTVYLMCGSEANLSEELDPEGLTVEGDGSDFGDDD